MLEPIAIALVGTWVAVVIVGHVLVFSAIYKCWREDRLEVQERDSSTSDDQRQQGEVVVHG